MSLKELIGTLVVPDCLRAQGYATAPMLGTVLIMDAAGESVAHVFTAPKTGQITKVGLRIHTVTQCTNGLLAGLWNVSTATGFPTTPIQRGTISTPVTTGYKWVALPQAVSVTKGDLLAIVVENASFATGDSVALTHFVNNTTHNSGGQTLLYTTAWATNANSSLWGIQYSDGIVFKKSIYPMSTFTRTAFNSGTNPNRRGLRFKLPFPAQMEGAEILLYPSAGDCQVLLIGPDGVTVLASISTINPLVRMYSSSSCLYRVMFPSSVRLEKDTWYRLMVVPSSATSINLYEFTAADDGAVPAMNGIAGGADFHMTTCNGAPVNEASYTNITNNRPLVFAILSQFGDETYPSVSDVRAGVQFDGDTKTGLLATGFNLPAEVIDIGGYDVVDRSDAREVVSL